MLQPYVNVKTEILWPDQTIIELLGFNLSIVFGGKEAFPAQLHPFQWGMEAVEVFI